MKAWRAIRYFNYKVLNRMSPPFWQDGQIFLQRFRSNQGGNINLRQ